MSGKASVEENIIQNDTDSHVMRVRRWLRLPPVDWSPFIGHSPEYVPTEDDWRDYMDYRRDNEKFNDFAPSSYGEEANFEVTLNYPATASYKRMSVEQQKRLYFRLYTVLTNTFGIDRFIAEKSSFSFERGRLGKVHLHASMWFRMGRSYYCNGAAEQVVRQYLAELPLKHKSYKDSLMNVEYSRYTSPSVCVQFRDPINEARRVLEWETYINKNPI